MLPHIVALNSVPGADSEWDALVLVAESFPGRAPQALAADIERHLSLDARLERCGGLVLSEQAPGGRLVLAPTGSLGRDYDDVRRVSDAAASGLRRAMEAGAVRPAIALTGVPGQPRYARAHAAALLAALGTLWQPLEARESLGEEECQPVVAVGLAMPDHGDGESLVAFVRAVEAGRVLARDVAGTQPERMAPQRMADHCRSAFRATDVEVEIVADLDVLRADYPLLLAVARASLAVPRHQPCVIRLRYRGEGPIQRTVLLAGKGVTYDTGGADLKTGGHMAGMSRDKGGAAAVIGFLRAVAELRPPGLEVIAEVGAVRNSVGADSFVTDEILVSHAGVRVRVGNTDAEGRLVLADLLSHLRREAAGVVAPHIASVATLTGHAVIAVGPYGVVIDNGPAEAMGFARKLQREGELWGDPFEISRLRREDFDFIAPRSRADDVLSCNNAPSTATPRGHQFPMAFLMRASGLDGHGSDADAPLAYSHLDIGGSAVAGLDWQHGRPTGSPVLALCAYWLT